MHTVWNLPFYWIAIFSRLNAPFLWSEFPCPRACKYYARNFEILKASRAVQRYLTEFSLCLLLLFFFSSSFLDHHTLGWRPSGQTSLDLVVCPNSQRKVNLPIMYYVGGQTTGWLNPNNLAFFKSGDATDDGTSNLFLILFFYVSDFKILIMKCFVWQAALFLLSESDGLGKMTAGFMSTLFCTC